MGNNIKEDKMAGEWNTYEEKRNVYRNLVGKPGAMRPL
jgi:hypothetical protein